MWKIVQGEYDEFELCNNIGNSPNVYRGNPF